MFQSFTTYKKLLMKPLLVAAVFSVVGILGTAIPAIAFAQYGCMETIITQGGLGSNTRCIAPSGSYPDNTCNNECIDQFALDGITLKCVPIDDCRAAVKSTGVEKSVNQIEQYIGGIARDAILSALIGILEFINNMLRLLAGLVARLLDSAIVISLAGLSGIDAITKGWEITRDIANIFFIFILLIIAIATILRLESYGAKQLLPKLIIVALLINFSLVIARTVVDTSNVLALTFISRITPVSDKLATVLQINKITDTTTITPSAEDIEWQTVASVGWPAGIGILNQEFTTDKEVMNATPTGQNELSPKVIQFFWQATILILQLTLIFVFVALSVMLLVRSVALIIIFVLAPLGFLAAILPSTRGYSNQWWHKLFQWSFFFPASAFMIYLAVAYGAQMSQYLQGNPVVNMGMLFNYFATVAILIGSLIVAKQMGIVGAAAAIGIGAGIAKRARGYAGRTSMGAVYATGRATARATGEGAGRVAQKLGTYGAVGRFAAKPFTNIQARGEAASESLKKQFTGSRDTFKAKKAAAVTPAAQRAARQAAVDQGYADLLSPEERAIEYARATREHDEKARRAIEAVTPEMATTGKGTLEEQRNAVLRATQGQTADDIRTKMQAGQLGKDMVADAAMFNYGEQKMEAAVERFPEELGPALFGSINRMIDQIKADAAAAGTTITNEEARDKAVDKFRKDNAGGFKVAYKSGLITTTTEGDQLQKLLRASVDERNKEAADKAERAYIKKETDRGRTPSQDEIDVEREKAKKIEI